MDKTREILPQQASSFRNLGRGGFTTRGIAVLFYIDYWRSREHHDTLAIAAHEGWLLQFAHWSFGLSRS